MKPRSYTEAAVAKTDANVEGAIYRASEFRIILKAIAKQAGGQFQEDGATMAALIPTSKAHMTASVSDVKRDILGKVDVCGAFDDEQTDARVDKLVRVADGAGVKLGVELLIGRANDMTVGKLVTVRAWDI